MNAEFWSMGGYALYVWGSYAAGMAVFIWNAVTPCVERRALLRELKAGPA